MLFGWWGQARARGAVACMNLGKQPLLGLSPAFRGQDPGKGLRREQEYRRVSVSPTAGGGGGGHGGGSVLGVTGHVHTVGHSAPQGDGCPWDPQTNPRIRPNTQDSERRSSLGRPQSGGESRGDQSPPPYTHTSSSLRRYRDGTPKVAFGQDARPKQARVAVSPPLPPPQDSCSEAPQSPELPTSSPPESKWALCFLCATRQLGMSRLGGG